jgi:uncharacterized protein involved in type VI secretion and phage assembly
MLTGAIQRIAGQMDRRYSTCRMGTVQSYNPSTYSARVTFDDGNDAGQLSNWLPIACAAAENGWGVVAGPIPGMQAFVAAHEGDPDSLVIVGFVFAPQGGIVPPAVPAGEVWLVNQAGDFVKLTANGIFSQGQWTHTGDFQATGAIHAGWNTGDQVGLQSHTHTQGNDSHGDGEVPTNAPTAGT